MPLNPLSWFTDWADKLGIPVWVVWAGAIVIGFLLFNFVFGGRNLSQLLELLQQSNGG